MSARAIVIGGGIVGLCTALSLAERGEAVTLIERDEIGIGASMGNAGVISPWSVVPNAMPGVWKKIPRWLLDQQGPVKLRLSYAAQFAPWAVRFLRAGRAARAAEISEAMHALNHDNIAQFDRVLDGTNARHLVRPSSYVFAYRSADAARADTLDAQFKQRFGAVIEVIGAGALRALEPALSPDFSAAVVMGGQARALSARAINMALAAKLRAQGGEIVQAEVRGLQRESDGWMVALEIGEISAPRIAVCAGAWSARLLQAVGLRLPLEAERGYHAVFPGATATLNNSVMDADFRLVASSMDEGLRAAGSAEFAGLDRGPHATRGKRMAQVALRMIPALEGEAFDIWSGVRPSFPDSLPALGAVPGQPGLFVGFGHSHWGFMMGPKTGEVLAELMQGRDPGIDLSPYAIDRF